jgi:hypothetical protein
MFWTNTKLLFRLYYRPVWAMSGIIDEGHWLYAAISVVAIYYGKTLEQFGRDQEAREVFTRCLEAVKPMPDYRRGDQRRWRKLAQERLSVRVNTPLKDQAS